MGQDLLAKEASGKLLYQRVHMFAMTQEPHHITRKFVQLVGGFLRT